MTNFILVAFIYICQIRILASLIPSYKKIKLLWAPLESIPHAYIYIYNMEILCARSTVQEMLI